MSELYFEYLPIELLQLILNYVDTYENFSSIS